jgi:hypothetical protein
MANYEGPISENKNDNEERKFVETADGKVAVRTKINTSDGPVPVTSSPVSTPAISNITTLAATETSIALASGVRRYRIRARGSSRIQYSFTMGASATTYETIAPGAVLEEDGLTSVTVTTIYLQTHIADVVEVVQWT